MSRRALLFLLPLLVSCVGERVGVVLNEVARTEKGCDYRIRWVAQANGTESAVGTVQIKRFPCGHEVGDTVLYVY